MNKKRVIIIAVIIACLLVGIPVGYFLLNPAPVSTANWSLNGAPQNIVIIHNDLVRKFKLIICHGMIFPNLLYILDM